MGKHKVREKNLKNLKAFGGHIRRLRINKKMTQEQLADLAGVSENTIVTIEKGLLNPTIATLWEIAVALEVPRKDFFDF